MRSGWYVLQRAFTCCTSIPFLLWLVKVTVEVFTMPVGKILVWRTIFHVSLAYSSWNTMKGLISCGNIGRKEQWKSSWTSDLVSGEGRVAFSDSSLPVKSQASCYPFLDNFSFIIFMLIATFACLCVKSSDKLIKKNSSLLVVYLKCFTM